MPVAKGGRIVRGDDEARFASKTRPAGECLEWTGPLNERGYGKFMVGGARKQKTWIAHRWAFFVGHGFAPVVVRHKCDNPSCVRLDHLEAGTQLDNVHDAMTRGRRVQHLNERMVRSLRAAYAAGHLAAEARALGVRYSAAHGAATGRTWRHVK